MANRRTLDARPPLQPRRVPSQLRSRALVDAILIASEELLLAEGVAEVTPERIARRAGVSVGSLYQYFPNSLAVLRQLMVRHFEDIGARVFAAGTVATSIEGLVEQLVQTFIEAKKATWERSLALRSIGPVIEGQSVERELVQRVADRIAERIVEIEPRYRSDQLAGRALASVGATAGIVGAVMESDPDQVDEPYFRALLTRTALAPLID